MSALKTKTQKIKLNEINYGVRASQLATTYGPGSLVEFPEQTLITAAPEYWATQITRINDMRLSKMLKVDYFGIPTSDKEKHFDGVSYIQFPEWYSCSRCHKFQPIRKWIIDYKAKYSKSFEESAQEVSKKMRCPDCNASLVVSRIVVACEKGHIDDFPWVQWAHAKSLGGAVPVCRNPSLYLTSAVGGEGVDSIEVTCKTCRAKARLGGAFGKDVFQQLQVKYGSQYHFSCSGRHPWKFEHCDCNLFPRTMNRGSSAQYFPVNIASIVIPPYSSFLMRRIEESKGMEKLLERIETTNELLADSSLKEKQKAIHGAIEKFSHEIALEIGADQSEVLDQLEKKWAGLDAETGEQTEAGYKAEEYKALNGESHYSDASFLDDFQREGTDISKYNLPFLKGISLINKIREVVALTGFTRINPIGSSIDQRDNNSVVSVKEPGTKWYPAYQVYGEGVFLEFDEKVIRRWVRNNPDVSARAGFLRENYDKSYFGSSYKKNITPKFILLHTISHLLIKQLSFECGYGVSDLKERIYCNDDEGTKMAGILIYTASGDSEGTMGGLVRQGRYDLFPAIFKKAIETSQLCSNDPVCSLSNGQGRDNLNLAACHACTLIPETSCENFNGLLDRGMVIGTMQKESLGFFTPYIKNGWGLLDGNQPEEDVEGEESDASDTGGKDKRYMIEMIPNSGRIETSWESAWQVLLNYASTPEEKEWLDTMKAKVNLFANKEYPAQDAEIAVISEGEEFSVDLLWKESRVIYLSKVNKEAYEFLKNSDWKCVMADPEITPESFANLLKERKV